MASLSLPRMSGWGNAGPFSFRKEIANQAQNELKGFVPHRAFFPGTPS